MSTGFVCPLPTYRSTQESKNRGTRASLLASGAWLGPRGVVVAHRRILLAFPATAAAEGLVVRTLLLRRARQSPADTRLLLEAILLALGLVARILDGFHFVPVLAHQRRVQLALWQDV